MPSPKLKPAPHSKQPATTTPSLLDLPFTDEEGKPRSLQEYKGKLIVLNLWATWCAPCVKEMPALSQLEQDYRDKGLVVITLSQDDNAQQAKEFFEGLQIKNLPAFMVRLDKAKVHYGTWKGEEKLTTLRPDGVKQVYLQDPDNFWLEVNDDPF